MLNLNFRKWVEDSTSNVSSTASPEDTDPTLAAASKQAKSAAQIALKNKKNPIQAAQKAILASDVPMNKLGKILPKDADHTDA
jgi:hypothetical protein